MIFSYLRSSEPNDLLISMIFCSFELDDLLVLRVGCLLLKNTFNWAKGHPVDI